MALSLLKPIRFDVSVGSKTEVVAFPEHVRCTPNNRDSSRRAAVCFVPCADFNSPFYLGHHRLWDEHLWQVRSLGIDAVSRPSSRNSLREGTRVHENSRLKLVKPVRLRTVHVRSDSRAAGTRAAGTEEATDEAAGPPSTHGVKFRIDQFTHFTVEFRIDEFTHFTHDFAPQGLHVNKASQCLTRA